MEERWDRLALPAGTVLRGGGMSCTLTGAASLGGNALFYTARRAGSALPLGVKECCPGEVREDLYRDGGVLAARGEQVAYALDQARRRMLREAEISQQVAAVSARSIPAWDAPVLTVETAAGSETAPAGSFLLLRAVGGTGMFLPQLLAECALPPAEGHPLRTGGRPGLPTVARILTETLRAAELVRRAGYLHGDIQPGNLFFADCRPEDGEVGFGCLLDFGCARPLREGRTDPITDRMVFTTDGFTPPEMAWHNDGTLSLTPAADVYSVGRVLYYLLKGRTFFENGRDRVYTEGFSLTDREGERLGCTPETLSLLRELLDRSLVLEPEDRYQTPGEMLPAAERLLRLTQPPANRLALDVSALGEGDFLGREDLIREMGRALDRRQGPVVVCGFAGMGKTELAITFAKGYRQGQVHFVPFRDSVRRTVTGPIADAFSGYSRKDLEGREKPEEQVYREVLKLLGERSEGELLILDGMDREGEPFEVLQGEAAFRDLCALPMGLLVTTRAPAEGGIPVEELPRPLLRQLLCRGVTMPEDTADALLDAVEGHTLTVDLINRTLRRSIPRLAPETLLRALEEEDLDSRALARVSSPKDRAGRMARIQGHLSALFRLSDLTAEERKLMCYALPISEVGLEAADLARVPGFDQEALLRLIDRGWIRRSEGDILTLHPLVQETGWRELEVDLRELYQFARGVSTALMARYGCSDQVIGRVLGYLGNLYAHAEDPPTQTLTIRTLGLVLQFQGRWELALRWAERHAQQLEARPDKDRYPKCRDTALRWWADCLDGLGRTGEGEALRARADALGADRPEPSFCPPQGLEEKEAEWIRRLLDLWDLLEQGRTEEAAARYPGERAWCVASGMDPALFDLLAADVYAGLGEEARAYELLQLARPAIQRWERPHPVQIALLAEMAELSARQGRGEEGRQLLSQALEIADRLFPAERRVFLQMTGGEVLRLCGEQGWREEAAAWQRAMDSLDEEARP